MKSKWRCLERCRTSWWRSRPGGQGRRPERNDGVVDPLFEVAPVNKQTSVGIEFRYDLQTRTPNTFDSHRVHGELLFRLQLAVQICYLSKSYARHRCLLEPKAGLYGLSLPTPF